MSDTYLEDVFLSDGKRWSLAFALSVLLHVIVIAFGALIGYLAFGKPGDGGFIAFLLMLILGPFAAIIATMDR